MTIRVFLWCDRKTPSISFWKPIRDWPVLRSKRKGATLAPANPATAALMSIPVPEIPLSRIAPKTDRWLYPNPTTSKCYENAKVYPVPIRRRVLPPPNMLIQIWTFWRTMWDSGMHSFLTARMPSSRAFWSHLCRWVRSIFFNSLYSINWPLFADEYLKKCNEQPKKIETPAQQQQPALAARNPVIYDTASLKALLPAAQKHLVSSDNVSPSPITQVCQSLSKINLQPLLERSYKNEEEMKIKAAWPSTSSEAVEVVRRRKKSDDSNLNLINNNGSSEDMSLKRRSYHPQDYLSKVLQPETRHTTTLPKRRDFPKVRKLWWDYLGSCPQKE